MKNIPFQKDILINQFFGNIASKNTYTVCLRIAVYTTSVSIYNENGEFERMIKPHLYIGRILPNVMSFFHLGTIIFR